MDEEGLSKQGTYFSFNYGSPSCTSESLASICDFATNSIYQGLHHLCDRGNIKPAIISSIRVLWDCFESTFISPTERHYRSIYIPVMTSLGERKALWRSLGSQLPGLSDFRASQASMCGIFFMKQGLFLFSPLLLDRFFSSHLLWVFFFNSSINKPFRLFSLAEMLL